MIITIIKRAIMIIHTSISRTWFNRLVNLSTRLCITKPVTYHGNDNQFKAYLFIQNLFINQMQFII